MHKGRVYPYAFRHDLMIFRDYPALWPKKFKWAIDTVAASTFVRLVPPNTVSDEADLDGTVTDYLWKYHCTGFGALHYIVTTQFNIIGNGASLDLHLHYLDDNGDSADCTFHNAENNLFILGGLSWIWDTSTPPPAWVNTGSANVRWILPGGNDQLSFFAKQW